MLLAAGADPTLRMEDGGISAPPPSAAGVEWGWIAGAAGALILGVGVSGAAWKRGYRKSAASAALLCAILVGVLVYMGFSAPPAPVSQASDFPPKPRLKSAAACAESESLVDGKCMDADAIKATTMLRKAGFLAK